MKVRLKIILGFLVVALLVGVVGYISINLSQNALENELNQRLEALSFSRASHVSDVVKLTSDFIAGIAKLDVLEDVMYNIANGIDVEESKTILLGAIQNLNDYTNNFYRIKVLDKNGIVVAYVTSSKKGEDETGKDLSNRDYFTKGLSGIFIEGPRHSDSTNINEVVYGVPIVTDESDIPNGILIIHRALDNEVNSGNIILEGVGLNDIVNNPKGLGENGETFIVNSEGFRVTDSRFKEEDVFLKVKGEEVIVANCHLEGSVLEPYKNYKGDLTIGNAEPIEGTDWCLVAEFNVEELFVPANRLRNIMVLIALGVIILAILIGIFFSRSITNPLIELSDAADKISKGNLDVEIEVKSTDELGKLAQSFSFMRASLKAVIKQYEVMLQKTKKTVPAVKAKISRVKKKQGKKPTVERSALSPKIQKKGTQKEESNQISKEESNQISKEESNQISKEESTQKNAVQPEEKKNHSTSLK